MVDTERKPEKSGQMICEAENSPAVVIVVELSNVQSTVEVDAKASLRRRMPS
jgi:hypothetical protein